MRPERIVLEQETDITLIRWNINPFLGGEYDTVIDRDDTFGGGFQPSNHPEGGGFPTSRGAEQGYEGTVLDSEVQIIYGYKFSKTFGNVFQFYLWHEGLL